MPKTIAKLKRRTARRHAVPYDIPTNTDATLSPLELARIIPMPEVVRLTSLSTDTIKRRHGSKIIRLSPRRNGMRLRDALSLREGGAE